LPPSLAYQVALARRVAEQLRDAPPELRGYVAGVVALLRTDPSVGTAAFPVLVGPEYNTIVFPDRRGFLDFHVVEERRLVVLVDLAWP
jgi:hypothetical protein